MSRGAGGRAPRAAPAHRDRLAGPQITSEMTIVNESGGYENDTRPAILVIYTRTPHAASRFDAYRFRLEGEGEAPRTLTRAADSAGQQVVFRDLVPGRLYNVTMWTLSRNVTSHPVQRQARLCECRPRRAAPPPSPPTPA